MCEIVLILQTFEHRFVAKKFFKERGGGGGGKRHFYFTDNRLFF